MYCSHLRYFLSFLSRRTTERLIPEDFLLFIAKSPRSSKFIPSKYLGFCYNHHLQDSYVILKGPRIIIILNYKARLALVTALAPLIVVYLSKEKISKRLFPVIYCNLALLATNSCHLIKCVDLILFKKKLHWGIYLAPFGLSNFRIL